MSEAVIISLISAVALILSGVLVELVRARRRQDTVVHEMKPNHGGSLRDTVNGLVSAQKEGHDRLTAQLSELDRRLVRVETYAELYVPRGREVARGE